MDTTFLIYKMRYDRATRTWIDHTGRRMEWHDVDPLRFRDAVVWYLCQSDIKRIQRLGWKLWGKP